MCKQARPSASPSRKDGLGNVDTSYNSAITLTLGNADGETLSGVLVEGANDGVATFTGLSLNQPGDDYVILASSGNLTSATSDGFDVTVGPPYQLVVRVVKSRPRPLSRGHRSPSPLRPKTSSRMKPPVSMEV